MKLYTTGCPKCTVLKKKLDSKNIPYDVVNDIETIKAEGIIVVPVLELDNGDKLTFTEAVNHINNI